MNFFVKAYSISRPLDSARNRTPQWREETSNDWAKTKPKVVKFSYTWDIENFSVVWEINETLRSPVFPVDGDHQVKWNLVLSKKKSDVSGNEYLELRLQLTKWDGTTDKAKVRCFILGHDETLQKRRFNMSKHANITFEPFIHSGALFDKTKNLLPNDVLTIFCEIFILTDTVCTCGNTKPIKVSDSKFSEDFGNLFKNKKYSDVTIVTISGQEIPAHKNILSARSEVFEVMLNNDLNEGRLTINELDPEVLTEMLLFMYTDKEPKLDNICKDLLAAANKYLLERLKNMCENFLLAKLTIENAAETLILANNQNACQLQAHTIDFINDHKSDVKQTTGWKEMTLNHPHIVGC
ncbi:speckle-type POZ protein-like isoform X2 [Drosophila innubila]|uniref:speckle-type POZ protein-like isoform X2 n=1 Tax=Drosophila innubila TaxID=198719 RepID=UPI00148C00AA|nr:speckle-type POZ protein-like isoform X2 [Drosophila innubila]